jgi:hypothetical protein
MGEVGDDCLKCLDEGELGKGLDILLKSGFYNKKKKKEEEKTKTTQKRGGQTYYG